MGKMKVADFLKMLRKANDSKTIYVLGGWGFPLTPANKERAFTQPYNRQNDRKAKINAASSDTFAFDCCGLPRSILWGWCADVNERNGGAVYNSNGVPEYDAKQFMLEGCTEQSRDFSQIEAGEFLWLDGHCGVYLGDGLAIESTPIWKDGVQITAVANIGQKSGYNSRTWTYHGHLKYVDYSEEPAPSPYKNKWVEIDGKWYYYDKDGNMVKNYWRMYKGEWYYLGADGAMVTGVQTIDGVTYCFKDSGAMACDEWLKGRFYGMDGAQYEHAGEWKTDSNGTWWSSEGWYPRGRAVMIDGKICTFDKKGYLCATH